MPGEYAAIDRPQGPGQLEGHRRDRDRVAGRGDLRQGGGNEVGSALVLEQARKQFGGRKGKKVWADFRSAEDPEAPTTVHKTKFPYGKTPRKVRGRALPDPGTTRKEEVVASAQRRAVVRRRACCRGLGRARGRLERAARLGAGVGVGPSARGDGPAGQLLHPAAADGAGRPRAEDGQRARDRRPRRGVPRHQPVRAARPRPRLLVERDLGRPGHHRHLRGAALRARRLRADARVPALPVPRPVPAVRRPGAHELVDPEPRRPDAARKRDSADAADASSASSPTGR